MSPVYELLPKWKASTENCYDILTVLDFETLHPKVVPCWKVKIESG